MNEPTTIQFRFEIGGPVRTQDLYEDVDVDPLTELGIVERALTRTSVDYNREVTIRLGKREYRVWMFPDLVSQLRRTPEVLASLELGESIELAFPEHGFSIECQPRGDVVDCTLVRYGETHGSELYVCTRDDVTSAVRGLAEAVLRDSVTFGYLEQADATAFLV